VFTADYSIFDLVTSLLLNNLGVTVFLLSLMRSSRMARSDKPKEHVEYQCQGFGCLSLCNANAVICHVIAVSFIVID